MKLGKQKITIEAPRELCFEVVAAAGKRVEKSSQTEWVVEFVTPAGDREIRTLELVRLEPPTAIHYRWLEGPLSEVEETIRFVDVNGATTKLTYSGSFSVRPGPIGWLIGRLRVRPLFDRLVSEHLQQAKSIAERRARRSRVHPRANQEA